MANTIPRPSPYPAGLSGPVLRSLLAALAEEEVGALFETGRVTSEEHRTLFFRRPAALLRCLPGDDAGDFLGQLAAWQGKGYWLAGWLAYEFGYLLEPALGRACIREPVQGAGAPLAEFGVYPPPLVYDHYTGSFSGGAALPRATTPEEKPGDYAVGNLRLSQTREEYLAAIRKIKAYIAAGDTYQVNYTVKLYFDLTGPAEELYLSLRRNQSVSYGALLKNGRQRILSLSPELFFRRRGDTITVRPMKGTCGRGRTPAEDRRLAELLSRDIKNRSENVMIVDLLRNDLGRLCRPGGVEVRSLFDVERYETLHQMTSTIQGRLTDGLPLVEMFRALFPCGSVTGAPKIRTMEIIRELETRDRGVYTGAIGFLGPDGEAVFNVPIRTAVLDGGRGEMGIGSGIVWDSEPEQEWEECRLKGRFLTRRRPEFRLLETMLWRPGHGYWLLELHLDRLETSAGYFGFPCDRRDLSSTLAARSAGYSGPRRVRLTLAADGGVEITDTAWRPDTAGGPLPRIVISELPVDSSSPFLFHKTTWRELYDRERERAADAGCFEVIFRNEHGELTEGGITNLFILKDGLYYTPPVECGLLDGVFRRHFLAENPDRVKERKLYDRDLETADAVYVANSVRGLVEVAIRPRTPSPGI